MVSLQGLVALLNYSIILCMKIKSQNSYIIIYNFWMYWVKLERCRCLHMLVSQLLHQQFGAKPQTWELLLCDRCVCIHVCHMIIPPHSNGPVPTIMLASIAATLVTIPAVSTPPRPLSSCREDRLVMDNGPAGIVEAWHFTSSISLSTFYMYYNTLYCTWS